MNERFAKDTPKDRARRISVAVQFGDETLLKELGVQAAEIACPECNAKGRVLGDKNAAMRLEGFEALTKGGISAILCKCLACEKEVSLPF